MDADLAEALDLATTRLAQTSAAPAAATVIRAGRQRRLRRRAAAAAAGAAAAGALVFVASAFVGQGVPDQVAVDPAPGRTVPIGRDIARMLESAVPGTGDRPGPQYPAAVLASAQTTRGELLLIGVDLPSGKRCVLLRYAVERTPGGGGGGRCPMANGEPYAAEGVFDLSASQEQDPAGGNVSVVFGSAPEGTTRVQLSAPSGKQTEAPAQTAGGPWSGRAFFIAPWPVPSTGEIAGYDEDGQVLSRAPLPFNPGQS